jgi:Tol biopolymer transport system component
VKRPPAAAPRRRIEAALILLAFLAVCSAVAAPARAQFGKNKVHYESFEWSTIQTENFDVYYYEGEEETAFHAARMAERGYRRLSRILHHEIEERVPIIVYASHTDFQQTNISPGLIPEGVGGVTEYVKRRVYLPFTGSYGEFDHVLTHELVHAFQVDLLFGVGSDANPFSFQPPLWFMEGMAEYLSVAEVDPNTEMWLRWSALEGQLIPLQMMHRVADIRVYRIGQAIFAFLGERYGDERIGELLKKTVYFRSVEVAFEKTLGMDLESLNEEWEHYVRRKYYPQIVELNRPEEHGRRLIQERDFGHTHLAPAISPDGDRVVFIRDGRFSKDIVLASAIDGKILAKLVEGERSSDFESLRYIYTSIGWSPDGTRIAFPAKRGGEDVLHVFDVDSRKVLDTLSFQFDALYSPSFHPGGDRVVFTAIRGGESDLWMVELGSGRLIRLTDDPYLQRDPQWSPDGKRIAFVTDSGPDTDLENLVFGEPRIAILEVETGEVTVVPYQEGKNITPQWGPDGNHLAFVSDRDGISNLYVQDLRDGSLFRLTNLITGVTGIIESSPPFSWSRNGKRIVFTTFMGGGWELYQIEDPLSRMEEVETPESIEQIARRELDGALSWDQPGPAQEDALLASFSGQPDAAAPPGGEADAAPAPDSTRGESYGDLLDPGGVTVTVPGPAPLVLRPPPGVEAGPERHGLTLTAVRAETAHDLPERESLASEPYRIKWAPDFVGASPFFASNVGFAGSAQIALSDILSNHVIQIGASVYGSLDESDLFLGYYNLAHRTNWGVSAFQFRNDFGVFTAQDRIGFESQIYRGVQGVISRPFSKFSRLEFSARGVAVTSTVFDQSFESGFVTTQEVDSELLYFAQPLVALVTDNVAWGFSGPVQGTRMRLQNGHAFGDVQFNTTLGDLRKYVALGSTVVLATRAIGGASVGNTPQVFRLGGPETLRGVGYGALEGDTIGLLNVELRFPLVETLRLGWPLRIGLGGIQGVLFFDAGGAWSDGVRVFRRGHLDDVTAGYGLGLRLGLGYFALKYDLAQRTDLKDRLGDSRSYFSIGVDY